MKIPKVGGMVLEAEERRDLCFIQLIYMKVYTLCNDCFLDKYMIAEMEVM